MSEENDEDEVKTAFSVADQCGFKVFHLLLSLIQAFFATSIFINNALHYAKSV